MKMLGTLASYDRLQPLASLIEQEYEVLKSFELAPRKQAVPVLVPKTTRTRILKLASKG
jgi:hypothetical protein